MASARTKTEANGGEAQVWRRRGPLLAVALGALLALGFWAVGEAAHLSEDAALAGLDWLGAAVCHRLTERSFTIAGRQMPLCARCSGIYLGVLLAMIVPAVAGRGRWAAFSPRGTLLALLSLVALMGLDGINSYSHFFPSAPHLYEPRNWLRLITGLGAGVALGSLLHAAVAQVLWRDAHWRPALGGAGELGLLLVLAGAVAGVVLSNQPALLYVMAFGSGAGLLLALASINTIVVLVALRREGRGTTLRSVAAPLMVGLALAAAELWAGAALRLALFGTLTGLPGL